MSLWQKAALSAFETFAQVAYRQFEIRLQQPQQTQMYTLSQILRLSSSKAQTYREFQALPLLDYSDLSAQIETHRVHGKTPLSLAQPRHYEPTSGSSGASKWIPYTPALLHSFTQLFIYWAADSLKYGPRLQGGRIYFSVSPQFQTAGLADDADYLTGPTQWFFRQFQAAPSRLKQLRDPGDFFHVLCLYLLACPDLEVISIWSPSFLTSVLDYLARERQALLKDASAREVTRGGQRFVYGTIALAKQQALQSEPLNLKILFPELRLISAWGSHHAQVGLNQLRTLFPDVHLQAKGLLATEAPISFPSEKYGQFIPLIDQVFFEFLDPAGQIFRLDQVEVGQDYELIISQKSGLLRYRLGDRVRITGLAEQTPCFDFIGRQHAVSDLVGEKLNESFVAEHLQRLYPQQYCCLIPDQQQSRYYLLSEEPLDPEPLEQALNTAMHYFNARQLRQLNALETMSVPALAQMLKAYFVEQGMLLGNIKDRALYPQESNGQVLRFLAANKQ